MASVALLSADLLFGSRVEGGLAAAGHAVMRFADQSEALRGAADADVLVVDLTAEPYDVESLGALDTPTLGFYSHVEVEVRRRAEAAGFDLVVPRSRMAREMAALVERVAA
jgi:hypothetical protein